VAGNWVQVYPEGGITTFIGLTDTPASYTGSAGKYPKVNTGETALEFTTLDLSLYYLKTEMDSSGELAGIISDETGTGALVFANAPTIDFYNALASNYTYSGIIDSQPVGETVVFGMLLYFNWTDKEWKLAKANASTTMPGLRIALESKTDGQTCKMLVKGYIRDDVDFEFTGAMVYVSAGATAGLMTSTVPSTAGNQIQRVGVAKSADILFFSPSIDVGEI
jgi:hypothetical protein